ncbi:MAG TPA: hypothetical protein HPP77_10600 [Candidatus Hydrogenedentes bacterium]|nr:hypothetical protein [Candidatus Hydrogenedentota bacterium]
MGREEAFEAKLIREGLLDVAQLDHAGRRGISLAEAISELGYGAVGDVYRSLAAACVWIMLSRRRSPCRMRCWRTSRHGSPPTTCRGT